jgi:hypothetical protein
MFRTGDPGSAIQVMPLRGPRNLNFQVVKLLSSNSDWSSLGNEVPLQNNSQARELLSTMDHPVHNENSYPILLRNLTETTESPSSFYAQMVPHQRQFPLSDQLAFNSPTLSQPMFDNRHRD